MTTTPHYEVDRIEVIFRSSELQVREFDVLAGQQIPWHSHTQITDHCYCLSGTIAVETRDTPASTPQKTELHPGEKCILPPGLQHRITCAHGDLARYLLVQGGGKYDFHPVPVGQ